MFINVGIHSSHCDARGRKYVEGCRSLITAHNDEYIFYELTVSME